MNWTSQITDAWARVRPHVRRTPLVTVDIGGRSVALKLEQTQHTGSFKARGAFNNLLSRDVPKAGIVAASGGNHGAAAAFAAVTLGHKARIYVPEFAGPAKIALIRATGADLVTVEGTYAEALEAALVYEAETGAIQLHAYDAPETVAGQGTLFAEWEDQGLDADTVMIAVGGGGLIGGALAWFQGRRKVVGVEPELAQTLTQSLIHGPGHAVEVGGIAANALGARTIGGICHDLARAHGVTTVTLPDGDIATAQKWLWSQTRQLTEPAGAAALGAILSGAYRPEPGERVAVLVCGANIAPDPLG